MFVALLLLFQVSESDRVLEAGRLPSGTSITLDGRLDESTWQTVPGTDSFLQQEPVEGGAPTERTLVRVLYSRQHLYIGVMCFDREPDGVLSYQRQRDTSLATDDRFMWILDTYDDGRSAYFFEINPGGLMGDGLLTSDQEITLNKNWDGIWDARVVRGSHGWSAEIRIPFRTLNFEADRDSWGINFQRTIRRRSEELVWSGHRRNQGLFRPRNAGRLMGLTGMSQGVGLEVTPYVVAQAPRTWTSGAGTYDTGADTGVDITYSVTTNLRASLSINTEFAETEVDQRRINLTRFPLRYPEQRDFFLEGSSVFQFAPASGVYPYFSRRIGLSQGQAIPIRAGGRLAGQVGRFDVGFLQVRTAGEPAAEDFTVARAKAHILGASTLGFMYTRRATSGPLPQRDRHTLGFDLELSSTTFRGDKNLNFQAFVIGHTAQTGSEPSTLLDRSTRGIRVSYPNQPFFMHASYREFGSGYDPAVGFSPRNGFRRFQPSFGYSWLLGAHPVLREIELGLRHEYLMDLDFRPETVNTSISQEVRFESGDELEFLVGHDYERLRAPFDIRRDGSIFIPSDSYHTFEVALEANSAPQRRWGVGASADHGGFWTGTRTSGGFGIILRPASGMSLNVSWSRNAVRLDGGHFNTNLMRAATSVGLSPDVSLIANVQYDDLSKVVGLYARFRWVVRPGSNLYLVYTHNWLQDPLGRYESLSSQSASKLTYTVRF